ncbi:peroxisomal sarcosine oxidase isoform X2 [Manacus vitellinus]|uniref:peroxisomal sarcosine oxidase isoform X2 n=1 Tax=Manacus vitellinus TaxID=328815 RepID=UPI00115E3B7B|nr:peroxisomal sarcosine oxidase isoform X2 [Manacus vitellinus]
MAAPGQPQKATYDAIVIGAGIQGSFTAYHLAQRRRDTLLLEQFILPHSRGSSHGQSRIIRSVYPEEYYSRMMPDSFRLWQQLEAEVGIRLYRQTGLVVLGPAGNEELEACRRSLGDSQVLDPTALARHFPGYRLQAGQVAVLDSTGGVLFADRALRAVQEVFRRRGGTVRDGEKVLRIEPGAMVTVTTTGGVYQAPRLIITAGAWTGPLVEPLGLRLPLQPLRIDVCYWREKEPKSTNTGSVSPCFLTVGLSQAPHGIYGLPALEYPGMVKNTPDKDFILDRHPKFSNIIIGAGFSGHGFKLAPVVGKLLCELSLGEEPSHNMAPFAITRFRDVLQSVL